MDIAFALQRIETADLSLREYRAARRLLDRASAEGWLYLERDQACELFGTNTWGDARRILGGLKSAGLIDCHTNNCVYVIFRAESAQPRAENAHRRAESARPNPPDADPPRAENAQPRAESARQRAENAHRRAESARSNKDQDQDQDQDQQHVVNDPDPDPEGGVGETTAPPPPPPSAEQARSIALLTDTDVGCDETLAAELAAAYPFDAIRRQVFRFLRDLAKQRVRSPAALRSRLASPKQFGATITANDRASPLWARHPAPDDPPPAGAEPDPYADLTL